MTSFGMPTGPKSDIAELMYVAALHQTSFPELRIDGSLSASDIVLYLRSRYGIKIDDGIAYDIVKGLGGTCGQRLAHICEDSSGMLSGHSDVSKDSQHLSHGSEESPTSINNQKEIIDENFLDMVQWVSTLLIPSVIRSTDASCYSAELNERVHKIVQELRTVEDASGGSMMQFIRRMISRRFWQQELLKVKSELRLEVDNHLIPLVYDILAASLNMDKTENKQSNSLTTQSLSGLLLLYGEVDASNDKDLLLDMINCVDIRNRDQDSLYFTEAFFTSAITHDISGYERRVEDKMSTSFFDVFHCDPSEVNGFVDPGGSASNNEGISLESSFSVASGSASYRRSSNHSTDHEDPQQEGMNEEESPAASMNYISSAPYIDYAVDCQRGIMFSQFMWIYSIFLAVFYVIIITHTQYDIFHCDPGFLCKLGNRLWTWTSLGVMLSCGGVVLMVPISFVNDPYKLCFSKSSISMLFILAFTVAPYLLITDFIKTIPHGPNNQFTDMDSIMSHKLFKLATQGFLSFGILMMASSVMHICGNYLFRENRQDRLPLLRYCNCRETTGSLGTKHAATHKINKLLENAMAMHESSIDTENILRKFLTYDEKNSICGGVVWTWKQILKRNSLLHEHGIWLPSRLAIGQLGQIIVFVLTIVLLRHEKDLIIKDVESIMAIAAQEEHGPLKALVLRYTPNSWIIAISFNTGIVFAAVIGIILMLVYIPSTVATTLKLRSGALPSMLDVQFYKYRYSADTTTYNVGNMIYGLAGSMGLFFVFFGGLIFLCLWQITKEFMIIFLAWFTALMITILLHYFLTRAFRKRFYTSFYRQRPRAGNLTAVAMECWHIGLGAGVLASRLSQFVLASAFWIGRIDSSFLHEDVHIFGYRFDTAPINFRKDILVHEAHRHPYIDRLGMMYLMRLKHGSSFCTDAGCAWRRLFVLALMPWLTKYRKKKEEKD